MGTDCLNRICGKQLPSGVPTDPAPLVLTHGGPNPVAFGIDEPPDLRQVAVPLGDVFDGG